MKKEKALYIKDLDMYLTLTDEQFREVEKQIELDQDETEIYQTLEFYKIKKKGGKNEQMD